mmetsp:Transcript_20344/g.39969  ORF Transcript_20344/g.39969 Transcript_20344/m.39969 type:complete len:842 (-) Transcript_20344:17-2542(-)
MSLADSLEERFDPESDSDSDSDLDLEIDKYKGKVSAKSDVSKEDVEAKKDEIVKRNESVSPVVEDNSSTVKTNDMFTHPIVKHTSIGDIFWAYGYMNQNTIRWPCFVIRNRSVLSQTDYDFMKNYKGDGTHLILFADPYKSFFEMLPENDDFLDHPFDPNSAEHDLLVNQFKNYSKTPSKSKRRKSSKSKPPLTKKLRGLERSFEGALEFATKVFELAQERAQREDEMLSRFKEKEKKEFDEAINERKVAASKLVEEVTKIISSSAVLQDETIMSISPGDTIRILHMSNVYVSNVTKIETIDKAALRIHFSTLVTGIGPYYTVKNSSPQKQKRASSRRSSQDEGLTRDLIIQKVLPIEMILKIGEQDPSDPRSPIAAKGDCALAVESGDPNSLKTASNSELVTQMTSISESDVRNDAVGGAGVDVSNTVEKPSGEKVVQVATPMDTADGDVPDSLPYSENADIVPKDQASISANENPDVNEVGGAGTQETMVVSTSEPENPESLQCTTKGQDSQLSLATSNAMNAAIKPIHKEKAGEVRKEPNSDQSSLNEEKAMEVKEDTSSNQAEGDQTHSDERPEEAKEDISSDDADNTKPVLEDTIQETQGENNGDQADKGKPFLEETIQNAKEETNSDQAGDVKPLLDGTAKETKEKVSNEISCDGLNPNAELKPVEVISASSEAPSVSAPLTPKKKRFIYVTPFLSIKNFRLIEGTTANAESLSDKARKVIDAVQKDLEEFAPGLTDHTVSDEIKAISCSRNRKIESTATPHTPRKPQAPASPPPSSGGQRKRKAANLSDPLESSSGNSDRTPKIHKVNDGAVQPSARRSSRKSQKRVFYHNESY